MLDDYKYSVGRAVVYRHPDPGRPNSSYGQHGPRRTVGEVRAVETSDDDDWVYSVENLRTGEIARVRESEILHATYNKRRDTESQISPDVKRLARHIAEGLSERPFASYLKSASRDFVHREDSDDRARREGRDLPLQAGDYIRVRGELRSETEPIHNHYAKVLEIKEPDVAAIERPRGLYAVRHQYRVLADDGSEHWIYDPEIKLYYTADGRGTILNWRAATFLAEAFGDEPPYRPDFSYLQNHIFSRDELEPLSHDELVSLFARLLYVKGRIGLRDLENEALWAIKTPAEYITDDVLAISRFDMWRNRNLTPEEIRASKADAQRLRRMLHGD